MKKQVITIHGGDTFETYEEYISFLKDFSFDFERMKSKGWKGNLQESLGEDFEVIAPQMPNKNNAKYLEWKIWFEKLIPIFKDEAIFVGHSLGGIFLAKYFSEERYSKKIKAIFLVAPPFDAADSEYTMADFVLPNQLSLLQKQGNMIFIYQSKDDHVVPFADIEKYRNALPLAKIRIFDTRGHFSQSEFPEIIKDIQNLS